ncbi:hypothetical protein FOCC_FOCC003820 [Frankliniella occidentalis]|nr:hypothetical protein FOCC_FOCC003820 [Frankliniella occidentalis]
MSRRYDASANVVKVKPSYYQNKDGTGGTRVLVRCVGSRGTAALGWALSEDDIKVLQPLVRGKEGNGNKPLKMRGACRPGRHSHAAHAHDVPRRRHPRVPQRPGAPEDARVGSRRPPLLCGPRRVQPRLPVVFFRGSSQRMGTVSDRHHVHMRGEKELRL